MQNCQILPATGGQTATIALLAAMVALVGAGLLAAGRHRGATVLVVAALAVAGVAATSGQPATAASDCPPPPTTPPPPPTSTTPPDVTTTTDPGRPTTTTTPTTTTSAPSTTSAPTTTTEPAVPPVAANDTIFVLLNTGLSVSGNILVNDFLGTPPTSLTVAGNPVTTTVPVGTLGDLTVLSNGNYEFEPSGVTGVSAVGYTLTNGAGSSSATITVEVVEVN